MTQRSFERAYNEARSISLTRDVMKNADGSCLAEFGDTKVLCSASVQQGVPAWRKNSHKGWVTAEYALLPASCATREPREHTKRKGRSMEIERLIGRSLRSACDLSRLEDISIIVDCDVIQADGGTRCASICGAWVALYCALEKLVAQKQLVHVPLTHHVAAVSAGVVDGEVLLDLDYSEDSNAEVDFNFIGDEAGNIIEIQGTGEARPFSRNELMDMLDVVEPCIAQIVRVQQEVTGF